MLNCRLTIILWSWIAWNGTFLANSWADDPASKNLLSDPSLEKTPLGDKLPEGWNGMHSQPENGYRASIVAPGRTDQHSLLVEGQGEFGVVRGNRIPIDRGQRYRAQGWVKIEGGADAAADVKFHYYDADGRYIDQTRVTFIQPRTPGWHQIRVIDQLEQFPEAATIELAVAITRKSKAWFDDLEFTSAKAIPNANLVANGDMEDRAADRPAGWFVAVAEGGEVTCAADQAVKHAGQRSLHLTGTGEWIAAGSSHIRVDRAQNYELQGFVRAKRGNATLAIAYFAKGQFLGITAGDPIATGDDWRKVTVRSELDQHPTATHLSVICNGREEVDAWYDNLQLTRLK